ncbi:MAG: glycoside hydrolase family 130 protein [Candidatus Nanopelagicales bacterium]
MSRRLVTRTSHVLHPDPTRVLTTVFLPGQEMMTPGTSRATTVLDRVLALSDEQVDRTLERAIDSFASRHRDIAGIFDARFQLIAHRVADPSSMSVARRLVVGAYFSQEYAVESAALFNPSMVAHPDQSTLPVGATRFVMSVRAVGEGHMSSIGWRTGTIDVHDRLEFDELDGPLAQAQTVPTTYSKAQFQHQLGHRLTDDDESAGYVLAGLPDTFDRSALERAMATLNGQSLTRGPLSPAIERLDHLASAQYTIRFPADSSLCQRVIMPGGPAEEQGLEDLRLVRFTEDDGSTSYRGTYTAFDGTRVTPALLRTTDFLTFDRQQATGPASQNKGMALFPRAVSGRYLALSRWDRESTSLAESADLSDWGVVTTLQQPAQPWEVVQVGNCGSPIETAAGWLVLTHGVGPMREYGIGAMLLDLRDPSVVLGSLEEPLLTPTEHEREGYVPNVVYSCGAMLHGDTIVLPYGCSDSYIRIALVDLEGLLSRLSQSRPRPTPQATR